MEKSVAVRPSTSTQNEPSEDTQSLSSDDEFEDATNYNMQDVCLEDALVDCEAAMKLFFCNEVEEAMILMRTHAGTSFYHSLGRAIFAFIPAILTYDRDKIKEASTAIRTCIALCNKSRKHQPFIRTIGAYIKKFNYARYTDLEAHAELVFAEALLLEAALTIIEGEDLKSFFKGALKLRTCFISYKHCSYMLWSRQWESEASEVHFRSGVTLGNSTFLLMISMLPLKLFQPLQFVGYRGNKCSGLKELIKGYHTPGLRRVLFGLVLLGYHLILQAFTGGETDFKLCEEIIQDSLLIFQGSMWFMALKGRFEFMQGNISDAINIYKTTSQIGSKEFHEFRQLCYWELMWISALKLEFRASSEYAEHLINLNGWSRTTYIYMKASALMQLEDATDADRDEIDRLMSETIPGSGKSRVKIAGKSLPMEKFIIKRCARYHNQKKRLVLPAFELLCVCNLLPAMRKNIPVLNKMLQVVEKTSEEVLNGDRSWMGVYEGDNRALLLFIQGCLLSAMQLPRQAIGCLREAISLRPKIKEDEFLVPYSLMELAMCYKHLGNKTTFKHYLIEARKFSSYSLESRLLFRLQEGMQTLTGDLTDYKTPSNPSQTFEKPMT